MPQVWTSIDRTYWHVVYQPASQEQPYLQVSAHGNDRSVMWNGGVVMRSDDGGQTFNPVATQRMTCSHLLEVDG